MLEKFISYLKAQVGNIYVWGAQGETRITEGWIRGRETTEKNADRAIALYKKRKAENKDPIAAFDCSGLIVKFLLDNKLISADTTSRGLYAMCEKLESRDELERGDLLFRHDGNRIHHVGVYIGGGMVIEAKGRDDGVVLRGIDDSGKGYWNRYGRLKALAAAAADEEELPGVYIYGGKTYVNLRRGPGEEYEAIDKVYSGESVLVIGIDNGWADIIKETDEKYIRGFVFASRLKKK